MKKFLFIMSLLFVTVSFGQTGINNNGELTQNVTLTTTPSNSLFQNGLKLNGYTLTLANGVNLNAGYVSGQTGSKLVALGSNALNVQNGIQGDKTITFILGKNSTYTSGTKDLSGILLFTAEGNTGSNSTLTINLPNLDIDFNSGQTFVFNGDVHLLGGKINFYSGSTVSFSGYTIFDITDEFKVDTVVKFLNGVQVIANFGKLVSSSSINPNMQFLFKGNNDVQLNDTNGNDGIQTFRAQLNGNVCVKIKAKVENINFNTSGLNNSVALSNGYDMSPNGLGNNVDGVNINTYPLSNANVVVTKNVNLQTYICPSAVCGATTTTYEVVSGNTLPTWSNGEPDYTKSVTIKHSLVASKDYEMCSLLVASPDVALPNDPIVSFTIPTGKTLYVQKGIVVNTGIGSCETHLIIESDASLVQNDVDAINQGIITVKRKANPLYREDYTIWCSPVSGSQKLLDFSPLTLTNRFYTFSTVPNSWLGITSPATTPFSLGSGYLIRMPNSLPSVSGYNTGLNSTVFEGLFNGVPNNGNINVDLGYNPADPTNSYNVVGNPYPSNIDFRSFILSNMDVIEGTVWFWRKRNNTTTTSYAVMNLTGYVANTQNGSEVVVDGNKNPYTYQVNPGQGFMVNAIAPNAQLKFRNHMRSGEHGNAFFKEAPAQGSKFWVNMTGTDDAFSQMLMAYDIPEATDGYDNGYDTTTNGGGGSLVLYTMIEDKHAVIQAKPVFNDTDVIKIGFDASVAGDYTIVIDHMEGLFDSGERKIYLKDNLTGTVSDLSNPYTFVSQAGRFEDRFEIVYKEAVMYTPDFDISKSLTVYTDNKTLVVSAQENIKSVTVYDITGRVLYQNNNVSDKKLSTNLNSSTGVIVVKTTTESGKSATNKLVVK